MNKILAITLPFFYFMFLLFLDTEYERFFRIITGMNIGSSIVYLWKYKRKYIINAYPCRDLPHSIFDINHGKEL